MLEVIKKVKKVLNGAESEIAVGIVVKAAMPQMDTIGRGILLPACSCIMAIYSRMYWLLTRKLQTAKKKPKRYVVRSRKLRKHILISKRLKVYRSKGKFLSYLLRLNTK